MTSPSQGNPSTEAAIEELIKGREAATRLGVFLQEATLGKSAIEAFKEVLDSFSRSLSVLDSGQPLKNPAIIGVGGRNQLPSRIVKSKTLDDGYTWRKYGQKEIQSSKFPRAYFRCTHKYDQGCKAIRQVQRSEDDEFIITYMGEHTCREPAMLPHIISPSYLEGSCLISFRSNPTDNRQEAPLPSSFPSYKQECHEEVLSNLSPGSSSSAYVTLSAAYEGSKLMTPLGSTSDHGDVTSGFHSSTSSLHYVGFGTDSFEDIFAFDQDGFLQD
ncbi:probable WRKY transcription factor 70 [Phoenix dactylifera]|uniref:Probable WRKY transcription factor 70 n=1 Tax=Phoenix dactylifera TaxID=42345 RepID=A0A8B9ACX9_PHODC|nr:probable WRKY transcription factor 70 [Phoenix dactylifera]